MSDAVIVTEQNATQQNVTSITIDNLIEAELLSTDTTIGNVSEIDITNGLGDRPGHRLCGTTGGTTTEIDIPAVHIRQPSVTHPKPRYQMPPSISLQNIASFLQPRLIIDDTAIQARLPVFKLAVETLTEVIANISGHENKKKIIVAMYKLMSEYTDYLHANLKTAIVIKQKSEEFIIEGRIYDIIPYYNKMFNDHPYDNQKNLVIPGVFSMENIDVDYHTRKYNEDIADRVKRQNSLRQLPSFIRGEIVGVKDAQTGKWWMGKILNVINDEHQHILYYVEYEGWGEEFNEYISDIRRIERFNKYKHELFRSAKEKSRIAVTDDITATGDTLSEQYDAAAGAVNHTAHSTTSSKSINTDVLYMPSVANVNGAYSYKRINICADAMQKRTKDTVQGSTANISTTNVAYNTTNVAQHNITSEEKN